MKNNALPPFQVPLFCDKRLDKRAHTLVCSMMQSGDAVINRIFRTFTEKTGAYRMLNNKKTPLRQIIKSMSTYCQENMGGITHFLCIQDTVEVNLEAHRERMSKKKTHPGIASNNQVGCFVHPSLVIDAQWGTPIGFSSVEVWSRDPDKPPLKEKAYKNIPIEKRESYRWIQAGKKAHKLLGKKATVTIIADREADIYALLSDVPKGNTHILIRSNQDRNLEAEGKLLKETMLDSPIRHTYEIDITNEGRKKRKAFMELHYEKVTIKRPLGNRAKKPSVTLYCILTHESPKTVPPGEKPIEWCLLTTHEITNEKQSMECIGWYKCRWFIEELFRVLKRGGLRIEDIQLETMSALHKLLLFALQASLQVMALKLGYDKADEEVSASIYFSTKQIALLYVYLKQMNGNTEKLKNPFKAESLPWAAWILARLGGWSGYQSQSRPGYTTFKTGVDRFYIAWNIFEDLQE